MRAGLGDAPLPCVVLVGRRAERDVVDGAGPAAAVGVGAVERVEAAALRAAHLPLAVAKALEAEYVLDEPRALLRLERVRAHAVEAPERVLVGDLRVLGDERLVAVRDDAQLEVEPLGVGEQERVALAARLDAFVAEPPGPELERLRRADAEDH